MNIKKLVKNITNKIIAESTPIIGLYPGKFKPPHKGHLDVVKTALNECDEVHVIISNKTHEGYSPELSKKLWEIYTKNLPQVKISIAEESTPVTQIYKEIKDDTNNYLVIYGKGEEDRYKAINENREKYSNADIINAGNFDDISATQLREAIKNQDHFKIKNLIPKEISVRQFLNEIKINKPSLFPKNKNWGYEIKTEEEWEKIKYILHNNGWKWTSGKSILEKEPLIPITIISRYTNMEDHPILGIAQVSTGRFLNSYKDYSLISEIKINNPGLNFPITIKNEEQGIKIGKELHRQGWKWELGSPIRYNDYPFIDKYDTFPFIIDLIDEKNKRITWAPINNINEVFDGNKHQNIIYKAIDYVCNDLGVEKPEIELIDNPDYTNQHSSFGGYVPSEQKIYAVVFNRNSADIMRSIAHELFHYKQDLDGRLTMEAGEDGDEFENEANSYAGKIMREIGRKFPEIFENKKSLNEIKIQNPGLKNKIINLYNDYINNTKDNYDSIIDEDLYDILEKHFDYFSIGDTKIEQVINDVKDHNTLYKQLLKFYKKNQEWFTNKHLNEIKVNNPIKFEIKKVQAKNKPRYDQYNYYLIWNGNSLKGEYFVDENTGDVDFYVFLNSSHNLGIISNFYKKFHHLFKYEDNELVRIPKENIKNPINEIKIKTPTKFSKDKDWAIHIKDQNEWENLKKELKKTGWTWVSKRPLDDKTPPFPCIIHSYTSSFSDYRGIGRSDNLSNFSLLEKHLGINFIKYNFPNNINEIKISNPLKKIDATYIDEHIIEFYSPIGPFTGVVENNNVFIGEYDIIDGEFGNFELYKDLTEFLTYRGIKYKCNNFGNEGGGEYCELYVDLNYFNIVDKLDEIKISSPNPKLDIRHLSGDLFVFDGPQDFQAGLFSKDGDFWFLVDDVNDFKSFLNDKKLKYTIDQSSHNIYDKIIIPKDYINITSNINENDIIQESLKKTLNG